METRPDDIEDLPDGPNPLTSESAKEDTMIVLRAGTEEPGSISAAILSEYADGAEVKISQRSLRELDKFSHNAMSGFHMSLVMLCLGRGEHGCQYVKRCPVAKTELAMPIGRPCPWEAAMFKVRVSSLCNELGIDKREPKQFVDYNMVRDLGVIELMLERASMELSEEPTTVKDQAVATTKDGDTIYREEINMRYIRIDQLLERKGKILQNLAATRRERIRLGAMTKADPTSYLMALLRKRKADEAIPTMVTVSDPSKMIEMDLPKEAEESDKPAVQ